MLLVVVSVFFVCVVLLAGCRDGFGLEWVARDSMMLGFYSQSVNVVYTVVLCNMCHTAHTEQHHKRAPICLVRRRVQKQRKKT